MPPIRHKPVVKLFLRRQFPGESSINNIYMALMPYFSDALRVEPVQVPHYSKGLWQRLRILYFVFKHRGDVNHITGDIHFAALALPKRRTLVSVHSYILDAAGWLKRQVFWLFWFYLPLRRGTWVSSVSADMAHTLGRLLGRDDIVLIANPLHPSFVADVRPIQRRYPRILIVGTRAGKNLERQILALSGLPCHLRVIGELESSMAALLDRHVPDWSSAFDLPIGAMPGEYAAADLLLFATLHESFGLPIIEAQAVGRPVVTSKFTAMPEVAADAAVLVDPYDVADIRRGVLRVLEEEGLAESLVAKGLANVRRFDMAGVAKAYEALYLKIAQHTEP